MDFLANLPPWFYGVLVVTAICLGITFWAIWHAYWREFPTTERKMIWLVVITFIPFFGGIAYLLKGRHQARKVA
jgi:hypothetical protein